MVVAVSLLIISLTVGLAKLCISSIAGVSTLETLKTIKKGRSSFLKSQFVEKICCKNEHFKKRA